MTHEKEPIFGGADHRDDPRTRCRGEDRRDLPQVRHLGCDLLQVQGPVRRHDGVGRTAAADAGGGEREAEAPPGGEPAGQRGAEGPSDKKLLMRSEEHTSELQSLMRSSYAVFCLKKQTNNKRIQL